MPRARRRYFQRTSQALEMGAPVYAETVYPKYDISDSTQCGGKHTRRWAGATIGLVLTKEQYMRLLQQGLACANAGWEKVEFTIKRDSGQITLSEPPTLRVVR